MRSQPTDNSEDIIFLSRFSAIMLTGLGEKLDSSNMPRELLVESPSILATNILVLMGEEIDQLAGPTDKRTAFALTIFERIATGSFDSTENATLLGLFEKTIQTMLRVGDISAIEDFVDQIQSILEIGLNLEAAPAPTESPRIDNDCIACVNDTFGTDLPFFKIDWLEQTGGETRPIYSARALGVSVEPGC